MKKVPSVTVGLGPAPLASNRRTWQTRRRAHRRRGGGRPLRLAWLVLYICCVVLTLVLPLGPPQLNLAGAGDNQVALNASADANPRLNPLSGAGTATTAQANRRNPGRGPGGPTGAVTSPSPASPSPGTTPTPTLSATSTPTSAPSPTFTPSPSPVPTPPSSPTSLLQPPPVPKGVYFGAWTDPDGSVYNGNRDPYHHMSQVKQREALIGRTYRINNHYYAFTDNLFWGPETLDDWTNGRIPLISWSGPNKSQLAAVASGAYDATVLVPQAQAALAYQHPIFIRWAYEMNNNMPWAGDPTDYIAAWQHIYLVFHTVGATNVAFVWSPAANDYPNGAPHWTSYYPGDQYVDWVGMDRYNYGTTQSWSTWQYFSSFFSSLYTDYSARKPLMVAETGSAEQGGSKAGWFNDLNRVLPTYFPAVHAFVYFDSPLAPEATWGIWPMDTSSTSLSAYTNLGHDPYFGA